jgi:hypothetical protein
MNDSDFFRIASMIDGDWIKSCWLSEIRSRTLALFVERASTSTCRGRCFRIDQQALIYLVESPSRLAAYRRTLEAVFSIERMLPTNAHRFRKSLVAFVESSPSLNLDSATKTSKRSFCAKAKFRATPQPVLRAARCLQAKL